MKTNRQIIQKHIDEINKVVLPKTRKSENKGRELFYLGKLEACENLLTEINYLDDPSDHIQKERIKEEPLPFKKDLENR